MNPKCFFIPQIQTTIVVANFPHRLSGNHPNEEKQVGPVFPDSLHNFPALSAPIREVRLRLNRGTLCL